MHDTATHSVRLVSAAGPARDEPATLVCAEPDGDEAQVELRLSWSGGSLVARRDDYFAALGDIRTALEPHGLMPYCFGASVDVYPSGMIRSMGYGLRAYRLRMGHQARKADLVPILGAADGLPIGSVAAQEAYFDRWLASL